MATQIYTFQITYADCDNRIWRTAAVSSNHTLAQLGYLVLASFDTMAYHPFEMQYQDVIYMIPDEEELEELEDEEDPEDLFCGGAVRFDLLTRKVGKLGMHPGDTIEMTYDMGCGQVFALTLLEIGDMPKHGSTAYPKLLDGAGRGIVEDLPPLALLAAIERTDREGHSGICYSSTGLEPTSEWDYRQYSLEADSRLLKRRIKWIRDAYECEE